MLINGNTVEFEDQLMMDFNGAILLKNNNKDKYSTIFNSGISVTIEKAEDILQIMLLVPPVYKGAENCFILTFHFSFCCLCWRKFACEVAMF